VTPRIRSERRLSISRVMSKTIEKITNIVAAARMVGLISLRIPDHICLGRVYCSGPPTKRTMTTSSNEVIKAKRAPEITPGAMSGACILKKFLIGDPPKLEAARNKLLSNPDNEAVTVITTNGIPKIVCAIINPGKVATRFTLAKKKNIPAAVIISGTIIGEIMRAIIKRLNGMCRLDKPRAAKVPKTLAKKVAKTAIKALFLKPITHLSVQTVVPVLASHIPSISLYQRVPYPSKLKDQVSKLKIFISGTNCRNTELVNDSGITTMSGATKKNNTRPQNIL